MTAQFVFQNSHAFQVEQTRRDRAQLAAALDAALKSKTAPRDVSAFAKRTVFADALKRLNAEFTLYVYAYGPAAALQIGGPFTVFRLACAFGAIHVTGRPPRTFFTIEDLRRLKHSRRVGKRAKLALACLGECNWNSASRQERASFLYGEIVRGAPK